MKKGHDAVHWVRKVITPEEAPRGCPERWQAIKLRNTWKARGYAIEVRLLRVSYRPRDKTESYFSVQTDLVGGLPKGYVGPLNCLGHAQL